MMVRINLVPTKKRGQSGDIVVKIIAVMVILLLVELVAMWSLKGDREEEVQTAVADKERLEQDVAALKKKNATLNSVKEQAAELEAREKALQQKTLFRRGPQYLLDELKRVLSTPNNRPAIKSARKQGWNIAWDGSNVYLHTFVELGQGRVRMKGAARTLDDVAEFWLRLRTSDLFKSVRLAGISEGKGAGVSLQQFEFEALANFRYQTAAGLALVEELEAAEGEGAAPEGDGTSAPPTQ